MFMKKMTDLALMSVPFENFQFLSVTVQVKPLLVTVGKLAIDRGH